MTNEYIRKSKGNDDYNFSNEGYIAATEPKPQPKEFLINGSIKRGDL